MSTSPSVPTNPVSGTFAFTTLNETSSQALASTNPPASPYDVNMALLLGQCCMLTYTQYMDNIAFTPGGDANIDLSYLTADPNTPSSDFTQTAAFTWNEPLGFGAENEVASAYRTVMFGFALETPNYNIIALRGTQTYYEWIEDLSAIPSTFYLNQTDKTQGSVHGGFLNLYASGTSSSTPRPSGTLADQVQQAAMGFSDTSLPLYITGHSLGAGLAVLASIDMALNGAGEKQAYPGGVTMYNLAGPLVAGGISVELFGSATPLSKVSTFQDNFASAVPNAYRIVHSCDIIPILPPASTTLGPATINFGHVGTEVSFCAQSGSIGDNHYAGTYLCYLQDAAGAS